MITFNESKRLFVLDNGNFNYMIYINDYGHLETVYFGEKLEFELNLDTVRKAQITNNTTQYYDVKNDKEGTFDDGFNTRMALLEVTPHGCFDDRIAPIIIKKPNGMYETNFQYVSHKMYKGFPQYEEGPHAHGDDAETLEIMMKDEVSNIYCKLNISLLNNSDVIVKNFEIKNKGDETVHILKAASGQLDLPSNDYSLHHFYGQWAKERKEQVTPIRDGIFAAASNHGRTGHEENPFMFLTKDNATYDQGEAIGFNIIYSGNFKAEFESNFYNFTHVVYGINDYDFDWVLDKGRKFVTPQLVISFSNKGIDKMSQGMHNFINNNLITYKHQNEYKSIIFNSWEGCYLTFNTDTIISYASDAVKIGAELFVLDDGWFGHRDDDYSSLGDWFVNEKKIDLHKVIDHVHSLGMKFGIWFEPEMINIDSELYKKHPEYLLGNYKDIISINRHQFMLDFSYPEVVDNIFEQMCAILDNYKISYIKWDHNRDIREHFSKFLDAEHQGEFFHRYVLGYYSLIERLTKRYPDILFEGCASGGGRFDMGTLYYAPQIWGSDEQIPQERVFIQYNTSLGYPLSTIGSHANSRKFTNHRFKALLSLFGTYGYEMNPNKLSEEDIRELNIVADIYKKYHKNVIENGVLYHLSSPENSNFMMMEAVSQDKNEALVLLTSKIGVLRAYNRNFKLRGLNKESLYDIEYLTLDGNPRYYGVVRGEELMKVGLNVSKDWLQVDDLRFFIIKKVK